MALAPTDGRMGFLSDRHLVVAAYQYRRFLALFRTLLVQVTSSTPQATGRLFAVNPDMAEL
jgi:hypothetical protein